MKSHKISICVPTYNGEDFLTECLESIQRQSFTDFEVLVVDDDSTDSTVEIIMEFAKTDTRFRLERNPQRLGLVGNWNRCLQLASGDWIKLVFQDDFIEPCCLESLLEICKKTGSRFSFCRRRLLIEDGVDKNLRELLEYHASFQKRYLGERRFFQPCEFSRMALKSNLSMNLIGEPTATMFHRSLVESYGMFDPNFVQFPDWEYWLRVCCNEGAAQVTREMACFRVHGRSASSQNNRTKFYRTNFLDVLLFLHKIFSSEVYRKLRLSSLWGLVKPFVLYSSYIIYAREYAYKTRDEGSTELIEEWEAFIRAHPISPLAVLAGRFIMLHRMFAGSAWSLISDSPIALYRKVIESISRKPGRTEIK